SSSATDIYTLSLHDALPISRGGLILTTAEFAKVIDKNIFPGIQGGPLMHVIAAKAIAFGEALQDDFKAYQEQVIENAKALATARSEEHTSELQSRFDLVCRL